MYLSLFLIPESVGVFICGGGLAAAAIGLRWYLRNTNLTKNREDLEKTIG